MKKLLLLLTTLLSISSAQAVELINPYKGGSLAMELYAVMAKHLDSKNISYTTVTLDNCRAVPGKWNQFKSPLYIAWSDDTPCVAQAKYINVLSKATQLFCSIKEIDLNKKDLKIGWQANAPLNGIFETIEKKYGNITKVPYLNGGQQVQGVISGEIDVALVGQGSALSSSLLRCFMSVTPFETLPVFEHPYKDMYDSLIGISYEADFLVSIVKEYINLPEIKAWKEKRRLQNVSVEDEKTLFWSNVFNRK